MKLRSLIVVLIAILQPLAWWLIYNLLQPYAKANDSLSGLVFVCMVSPIAVIAICLLTISIFTEEDE
jgi:hypothetical protein